MYQKLHLFSIVRFKNMSKLPMSCTFFFFLLLSKTKRRKRKNTDMKIILFPIHTYSADTVKWTLVTVH